MKKSHLTFSFWAFGLFLVMCTAVLNHTDPWLIILITVVLSLFDYTIGRLIGRGSHLRAQEIVVGTKIYVCSHVPEKRDIEEGMEHDDLFLVELLDEDAKVVLLRDHTQKLYEKTVFVRTKDGWSGH